MEMTKPCPSVEWCEWNLYRLNNWLYKIANNQMMLSYRMYCTCFVCISKVARHQLHFKSVSCRFAAVDSPFSQWCCDSAHSYSGVCSLSRTCNRYWWYCFCAVFDLIGEVQCRWMYLRLQDEKVMFAVVDA